MRTRPLQRSTTISDARCIRVYCWVLALQCLLDHHGGICSLLYRLPCAGRDATAVTWVRCHVIFGLAFYRATRMRSADYAVTRCLSVRPSVCHTPVFCLKGSVHILDVFSPSGSLAILVYPQQTGWQYSDGFPPLPRFASNAKGV